MLPRLHSTVLLFAAGLTLYGCGGGGSSNAPPVAPADTVAPVIVVDTPLDGSLTNQAGQTLIGHLSEPATLTVNGLPAQVDASNQFSFGPMTLAEGTNTFALLAVDPAGNSAGIELRVTLDSIAPAPAGLDAITRSSAIGGSIGIIGLAGSVEAEATVYITNQATSQQVEDEIQWLILGGDSPSNEPLVEVFGGYWPDQGLWSEEFISGEEHSFDSICVGGRLVWHTINRYFPTPLEVLRNPWIQWVVLLPRRIDGPEFEEIRGVAAQARGSSASAEASRSRLPWGTMVSLLSSSTQSAPSSNARSRPGLLPPANPRLRPFCRKVAFGKPARTAVSVSSVEPLSTTYTRSTSSS